MKKKNIIRKPPTRVHSIRCTDEEWAGLKALAKKCGGTIGRYLIETGLKHHPRQRLTAAEVEALNSLAMARTDLIKISNALAKKSDAEKRQYFSNATFMSWWIEAVRKLIQHWYSIERNITSNVQTKSKEEE